MEAESIPKTVAGLVGLGGFLVAACGGLVVDNSGITILSRALVAMALCYAVGLLVGIAMQRTITEFLHDYQDQRPAKIDQSAALERQLERVWAADQS